MIWVIAGTGDSRVIIDKLLDKENKIIATTTTKTGQNMIKQHSNLKVLSGKLSFYNMKRIIKKDKIRLIVDASHPYAVEVSKNAIKAANIFDVPYLRYERKNIDFKSIARFDSYEKITEYLKDTSGNILLTIGSKNIKYFNTIDKKRLFIRILPSIKSFKLCKKYNFLSNQIIAIMGPFSKELNMALLKEFNIKYLVTKESGIEGGVIEKIEAAKELNIEIIIIDRPKLDYPNLHSDIDVLIHDAMLCMKGRIDC